MKRIKVLQIVVLGLLCLCLLGVVGMVGVSAAARRSGGMTVRACAGLVTAPHWRVGAAWVSPLSSYMPPLMGAKTAVCLDLPFSWTSGRINGEWLWP